MATWSDTGFGFRVSFIVGVVVLLYLWVVNPTEIDWGNIPEILLLFSIAAIITILVVASVSGVALGVMFVGGDGEPFVFGLFVILIILTMGTWFFLAFLPGFIFWGIIAGFIGGLIVLAIMFLTGG